MSRRVAPLVLVLATALALAALAGVLARGAHGQEPPLSTSRGVIYPAQSIRVRMDHSLAAHRALACTRCHDGAETSTRSADLLVPSERACLPCHAQNARTSTGAAPAGARCETCHSVTNGATAASSFPPPRITFSHAAHVSRGMACTSCHAGVRQRTLATTADLPSMQTCLRCHAQGGSAPSACRTCHLTEPDGVLRTRFAEGTLLPPSWLGGMEHDRDFLVRHRWIAADQGSACASCHRESDCADCHDGRVRPRRVHPGDFLTTHPPAARRDSPRCTSCHEPQRFCAECHARLGLATISAPLVRSGVRYHPPAAVWERGHAVEARRSMSSCVTCHAERDCVACHGAVGIGGGVSPHPPGFADSCAGQLRSNPRACVTCHGDLHAISSRCR